MLRNIQSRMVAFYKNNNVVSQVDLHELALLLTNITIFVFWWEVYLPWTLQACFVARTGCFIAVGIHTTNASVHRRDRWTITIPTVECKRRDVPPCIPPCVLRDITTKLLIEYGRLGNHKTNKERLSTFHDNHSKQPRHLNLLVLPRLPGLGWAAHCWEVCHTLDTRKIEFIIIVIMWKWIKGWIIMWSWIKAGCGRL